MRIVLPLTVYCSVWRECKTFRFSVCFFLFADNFPFKYHKRDTKSRIMYLDQLDKSITRHHKIRTAWKTKAITKQEEENPSVAAKAKHNINTNLQSCNNFPKFFFSQCVYLANSLIFELDDSVFFAVFSRFPHVLETETFQISIFKFYLRKQCSNLLSVCLCFLFNSLHAIAP